MVITIHLKYDYNFPVKKTTLLNNPSLTDCHKWHLTGLFTLSGDRSYFSYFGARSAYRNPAGSSIANNIITGGCRCPA